MTRAQAGGRLDEGSASLHPGSSSGPSARPAWTAEGGQAYASFGERVACAGDVDGDGVDDVLVAAPLHDHGQQDEGRAVLFLGAAAGLAAEPAWAAEGDQRGAWFGSSVAGAGDVDGDGRGDVVVGAPYLQDGQVGEGAAFVLLGRPR